MSSEELCRLTHDREKEMLMSRRWRLDLISGAELAHFVASRLFVMILSFSDFIFLISGGDFFSFLSLTLSVFTGWLDTASLGLLEGSREDC